MDGFIIITIYADEKNTNKFYYEIKKPYENFEVQLM